MVIEVIAFNIMQNRCFPKEILYTQGNIEQLDASFQCCPYR